MNHFEIQDDRGVLFQGSPIEAMRIWDILSAYKKGMSAQLEWQKHLVPFKSWDGSLKLVSVISEINDRPGTHILDNSLAL